MGFTRKKRIKVCFHQPRLWSTCVDSGFDSTTTTLSLSLPLKMAEYCPQKKTKNTMHYGTHTRFSQWDELPMSTVTSAAHSVEVRQKHVWNGALLLTIRSACIFNFNLLICILYSLFCYVTYFNEISAQGCFGFTNINKVSTFTFRHNPPLQSPSTTPVHSQHCIKVESDTHTLYISTSLSKSTSLVIWIIRKSLNR